MDEEKEAACSICGEVYNKHLMEPMNTGRRTQYLCVKCYRIGSREALVRAMVNQVRVQKQKEKNR